MRLGIVVSFVVAVALQDSLQFLIFAREAERIDLRYIDIVPDSNLPIVS